MNTCKSCGGRFDPAEHEMEATATVCVNCEDREWERKQKVARDQAQEWVGRAFGAFVGCASFDVKPPEFDMGYAGYVLCTLAGRNDEIIAACKKFVEESIPLIEAAQKAAAKKVGESYGVENANPT